MMFIRRSQQEGKKHCYHIITYEQKEYALTEADIQLRKKELEKQNVFWYPLKWNSGKFNLGVKILDFIKGVVLISRLRFMKSAKWMITLGSVSGAFGFVISRFLGMKQYAYQFEPHSEFLLDMQQIKQNSLSYILLSWLEKLTGRYAEIISTGTDAMIKRLKDGQAKGLLFKIPSAVDENKFYYSDQSRKRIRQELSLRDKQIFIYVGKIGGIYYTEELFTLFKVLSETVPNAFFIVLTPQDSEHYIKIFNQQSIKAASFFISRVSHDEISEYLCAADMGIVAIPPRPSQKYRSPIKVGEYLLCGLPYITCRDVSEDDQVANQYGVGVVLNNFSREAIVAGGSAIKTVLTTDKEEMRRRCREAGTHYRGFAKYYKTYSSIISSMS
jgi:hypothetical protein